MSSDEQHRSSADPQESGQPERPEPATPATPGTADTAEAPAPEPAASGQDGAGEDGSPEDGANEDGAADRTGTAGTATDETGTAGTDPDDPPAEPAAAGASGSSRSGPPRWLVLGSAALASAAFVVAAVFGVLWWTTATSDEVEIAETRDDVVRAASNAVVTFTELDHEKLDAYFSRAKRISTDEMRKDIESTEKNLRQAIAESKLKVVTTVLDVAVAELNVHEGKASVLATMRDKITQGEQRNSRTMRLQVEMTRVEENGEQAWKVSGIGNVLGPRSG